MSLKDPQIQHTLEESQRVYDYKKCNKSSFPKKSQYIIANTTLKEQKNRIDIKKVQAVQVRWGAGTFPR